MSRRYSLRRPSGLRVGQMDRRDTRRAEREKQRHRQGPDVLQGEYPIGNRISNRRCIINEYLFVQQKN